MAYKEFAEYILDQLSDLGEVRCIPMMGGYVFYYRGRIFGSKSPSPAGEPCRTASRRFPMKERRRCFR